MTQPRLTTEWRRQGAAAVLEVHGEVDLATAPHLAEALAQAPAGSDVVVDLGHVTFLDSTGITTLIVAHRSVVGAGETFSLAEASGSVKRILDVSGVGAVIDVHDTLEAALG